MPFVAAASSVVALLVAAPSAAAAPTCPNPNPVVDENHCRGAGSSGWRLSNYSESIGGFATQSSVNLGQNVVLKIGRNAPTFPQTRVDISVYRLGFYGGLGGRLIPGAGQTNVVVNNSFTCNPLDTTTGRLSCSNWQPTYTIPGSALPASGVYIAKLRATDTGWDTQVYFTVRDDARNADLLYLLPTASYAAYNNWGGKSLYWDKNGGPVTVAGTARAVKVSFDRPLDALDTDRNRITGTDYPLIYWLERQGYDVSYTEDVQAHRDGLELREHEALLVSGHAEYWSGEQLDNFKAARDAGVDIASFSANTSYWKVRYEDGERTLVCYKTTQGEGSDGSGAVSANDWGPDGIEGTADDALGLDQVAGTADDRPQNATTTFRDNGAPPGDPNAPPQGRVGPNEPENSLFGVMFVGGHETRSFPLTVPAANGANEFAGDRIWRNTGIPTGSSTTLATDSVGWEWDAVPTQAQYLAHQPAGVKRLSASPIALQGSIWLQDEGRVYMSAPPPGQPSTVNAVKYTAPSGALVFASGTIQWSVALSYVVDLRLWQATYNLFSDMDVQPLTPENVTLDGGNQPPSASFTVSPNPAQTGQTVSFNGSGSSDPDGTIVRYEWDLDGNGSYETDTGTTPSASRSYATAGSVTVRLRVTDNLAATGTTTRTLTLQSPGNQAPSASFTASPNPAQTGQTVSFNGSGSSDPDGTITRYEWDLDGNGSYETDTGAASTATRSYASPAQITVGLRVTDNGGGSATTTRILSVQGNPGASYAEAVVGTGGLLSYWRMGDPAGPTLADSWGQSPATISGAPAPGAPGALSGDSNTAVSFDGLDDAATAQLNLSSTNKLTLEFWLKWDGFADDDRLAFEFTDNFNVNNGGFLVDPNAPQDGGRFGVGIGSGTSRNNAFFARPSAGQWHHYALVFDTGAAPSSQITPYVDGQPVSYSKTASGIGAGNFADSRLHFMSRAALALFGSGDLDEVAIYTAALSPATIAQHYAAASSAPSNQPPNASFTVSPNPAQTSQNVSFSASGSSDPDGTIVKYEWDLDGNGSFETDTGTTPAASRSYSQAGSVTVGLRVTDDDGTTGLTTRNLTVTASDQNPMASFTYTPSPAQAGNPVTFDASGSSDPDGAITRYEWDLDGNGSYETDTGATAAVTRTYPSPDALTISLRVTDTDGRTGTALRAIDVVGTGSGAYHERVMGTPGLVSYWRMGESAGTTLADSSGDSDASVSGATLGAPGSPAGDGDTAVSFDGLDDSALASLNLSGTSKLTVEFWLKWDEFAVDDELAFEFTPNFGGNPGGFLVDPNAPQDGGRFGVGIGLGASRNNAFFARPSAGQWHHYALVFDTTAFAVSQIKPYVDGEPVPYTKTASGTGAGAFANSTLAFMSRNAETLFGAGDLDEVAIFGRALGAATIADHYGAASSNQAPTAAFTIAPNPAQAGQTVSFDASASSDPDGTITRYEWDLDGDGSFETDTGTTAATSRVYGSPGTLTVRLRVSDNGGATRIESHSLTVQQAANQQPTATFSAPANPQVGQQVTYNGSASTDPEGPIARFEWDLDGDGSYETDSGASPTVTQTYSRPDALVARLRVTDSAGATAATKRTVIVRGDGSSYVERVVNTAGLLSYWRLGERAGTVFGDATGLSDAAVSGASLGVAGALGGSGDPSPGAAFDGANDSASAPLDLSMTNRVTVEFWLRWHAFADDDHLALEFTPSFNQVAGGFLVDPNATGPGSSFGVGIGIDGSRNNAFFARPSAGEWHHYAIVLDRSAPPATQILPYVDGVPVEFTKTASGPGTDNFANSQLFFMSRGANALFGAGSLDELAIYGGALGPATILEHYLAGATRAPNASFVATPNPVGAGQPVSLDASASSDPDGTIATYEWDLDDNGSFEVSSAGPTTAHSYATTGTKTIRLRVTDNVGATATTTRSLNVTNSPPTPSFTIAPNPAATGQTVTFDGSASSDAGGAIARWEWDRDGNGSFEVSSTTSATTSRTYTTTGARTIRLRVTDGDGATAVATRTLTVNANQAPVASFTVSPNPADRSQTVTFDGSASSDPDGPLNRWSWDLDGNGSFETNSTTPVVTRSYATAGNRTIRLRVRDTSNVQSPVVTTTLTVR